MSLERAPPTRYRVEEKDGRLIVHDTLQGEIIGNQFAKRPLERAASKRDGAPTKRSALNLVARANSALETMEKAISTPETSSLKSTADQDRAKRGAIVAVAGIAFAVFAVLTGLWIGVVLAFIIPPVRQALITRTFPAIKLYIAEGRWR